MMILSCVFEAYVKNSTGNAHGTQGCEWHCRWLAECSPQRVVAFSAGSARAKDLEATNNYYGKTFEDYTLEHAPETYCTLD